MGIDVQNEVEHLPADRHLDVQAGSDRFSQESDVAVLDVPAVLAYVNSDGVGAAEFGKYGRVNGIGSLGLAYRLRRRGGRTVQ